MGALCPKPKKDDNWSDASEEFLEDFANVVCDDSEQYEQCKREVKGKNEFDKMVNSILEQKKKSEKDPEDPKDPKKLRFN